MTDSADFPIWDLLIIGAGPAGLAASCAAQKAGLNHLVLERAGPVQALVDHPQQITYFSPADEMAIGSVPFPVAGGHKPTREDALAYFRAVILSQNLPVRTWEEMTDLDLVESKQSRLFHIQSVKRVAAEGEMNQYYARNVMLCTGTFLNPRILDIPGAEQEKVKTRLDDPTPYLGRDVLVLGGGNSAATAAMTLADAGAKVTLAMRRSPEAFQSHLRPFIVRDLTIMADEKRLDLWVNMRAISIELDAVKLVRAPYDQPLPDPGADVITLPNDFVFALIGHTADQDLFSRLGIDLDPSGLPVFNNETGETAIPGLWIAGSLSHANIILEARSQAVKIIGEIAAQCRS